MVANTGGLTLRCRQEPNIDSLVLTRLAEGTQVPVLGDTENGWTPVECGNQSGWVSTTYLDLGATPTPATGRQATVSNTGGATLRCRTNAGTWAAIITSLQPGAAVDVSGPAVNGWIPVRCAGQDGWVSADYVAIATEPDTTPVPDDPATPSASTGTVSNTGGLSLRCRTEPTTDSGVITLLPAGAQLELRDDSANGWTPVRCASQDGWVSSLYVTPGNDNPSAGSVAYIDTGGGVRAFCRAEPGTSAAVITAVAWGSQVNLRGAPVGEWTPVRCGEQDGWIFSGLLVSQPPAGVMPTDWARTAAIQPQSRRRA